MATAGFGRKLALIVAVAALAAPWSARANRTPTRPNVLVIVTDDQALGTMAAMPQTRAWLGTRGTRFANGYATTPACCPSRASIFTGLYAHNHGVLTNRQAPNLDPTATVQHRLHEHGYRTAIFGKYLNRWPIETAPPNFDSWAIFTNANTGYSGGTWNVQGEVQTVDGYGTGVIADEAARFLWDEAEDRPPWLMFVSTAAPHAPSTPQARYADAGVAPWDVDPSVFEHRRGVDPTGLDDKPPFVRRRGFPFEKGAARRVEQLKSLISVDDLVGRLHRILGQTRQLENTLVIFLSDNGYLWGQHGRLGKSVPYQPSVRIPMLLSWPGRVAAGRTDDRLVATIDVAPTILHAAGIAPFGLDGRSLLRSGWDRDRLLLEYWDAGGHRGVPGWASTVTAHRQYVEYYADGSQEPSFIELYDRKRDPYQLANLVSPIVAELMPALVADRDLELDSLAEQLAVDRSCAGSECP